jgi:hypothetical protein
VKAMLHGLPEPFITVDGPIEVGTTIGWIDGTVYEVYQCDPIGDKPQLQNVYVNIATEIKEGNHMNEISKEELERIARKQSDVIKQLHNYIFMNENIPEDEREFILTNLDTVLRLY